MIDQLIGFRYRVIRELGRGGMGVVYIVEHIHTGDHLALKLLLGSGAKDAKALDRFKREAQASARIKSAHVVKVVDADVAPELDGAPFLVMELLDGDDLEKLVVQRGRLAPLEAVDYLSQAARALDRSHQIGIVHRDLKPENLFLHRCDDGTTLIKVLDFGISKMLGADAPGDMASAGMTKTGAVLGTPIYMAPEQARGKISQIAAVTDVWALGLVAVRLLTGEIYWRAETIAELMVQILSDPMYPPSERWPWLPPGFDAWFARSCARETAQRYPGAGQQIDALAEVFGLQPSAAARESVVAASAPVSAPHGEPSGARPVIAGASTTNQLGLHVSTGGGPAGGRSRVLRIAAVLGLAGVVSAGAVAYRHHDAAYVSAVAAPVAMPAPTTITSQASAAALPSATGWSAVAAVTPSTSPSARSSAPVGPDAGAATSVPATPRASAHHAAAPPPRPASVHVTPVATPASRGYNPAAP